MIELKSKFVNVKPRLLGSFNGITIIPWVFYFGNPPKVKESGARWIKFCNHENIHVRQVEDVMNLHYKYVWKLAYVTGWIHWYSSYIIESIRNGYRGNIYELEAYDKDDDLTYLDTRKPFAHKEYVYKKYG